MTIDTTEYSKAVKRAVQDKHNTGMALADMLGKQRMLRTKSMGRAKVDTGYYESMYERLIRAKQAREGITNDAWEQYLLKRETVALDKCVRSNQRAQRKKQAKINVGKMMQ
mmetsp:Transcript_15973/g.20196  ORF Transcript_15973/g.20196 Transcript_15973/m.20196 type:complete len:111 (-) Transcript_15973:921-1253(-)|eukprot:CAMPEP_0170469024 /NCGR_PEP_ID=MMETSP0123-20130129/11989_1 /TAXON_ID=182087 /ORGANISM="Favella ehrenbergii, Strain Fehren 1" /LENGTH=110 /DNA_ID=CAMNT_0010735749 /DNA_START=346 /DNA_END=678 /DNA_ORIENTATION=+